jgi:dUTP pyrophosphatase
MKIKFKLSKGCENLIPKKSYPTDSAFDLMSRISISIEPFKTHMIPTGLYIELPLGYEAQIRPRSGLALNNNITITNSPATIDSGYRGEIGVLIFNLGKENYNIKRGERIAQMIILKLPKIELVMTKEIKNSDRNENKLGSTGKY